IIALLGITSLATFAGLLQAWPLAILIDTLVGSPSDRTLAHRLFLAPLPQSPAGRIAGLALLALALRLIQELLATGRKLLHSRINHKGTLRLRRDLFRKLQVLHVGYHRSRPLADSIYRLTTDTAGCPAVLGVLINVVFAVITLLVILVIMGSRNFVLTTIALAVVPGLVWANLRFGRRFERETKKAKEADTALMAAAQRSIAAIGLVQSFGREDYELHRFGQTAQRCVRSWLGIHRQEVAYGLTIGAILGINGALILAYGGYAVYSQHLTPGELMIFMSYLSLIYDPLCQLTGAGVHLRAGLAGAERVFEVLDQGVSVADRRGALPLPLKPRALVLKNVSFHYAGGRTVLKGVTITIPPGTAAAFVGASGAGKTTLLNLIPRFYDPTGGVVALDDHDLRTVRLKDVRRHIALALQDSIILPTTIWENIAYGHPEASASEIREAARLAGAASFIEALPQGYETELGEGGHNLSGGQRQRIAVARALLTHAPILVLDEPTSALDSLHENILKEALASLRGKRTIILVSHRITTVQDCDMICVIADGRIAESGSHDELLRRCGHYYKLAWATGSQNAA
ncbi:MAG TPA: ABC transporter ATP-binding protein, partial [Candidatus Eisenbacteria bacterium]|nr:ABC transporter ATP-binding protein [Candidatus Eisenbacteria bacterium]